METKKDDIMLLNEWCTSTVLYLSWHFITQQKPQYFSWNYSFENISFCYFFYIFSQNHFQKHFTFLQNYFLSQLAKLLSSQQMHDITIHYSISVLARNRWHESIGLFEDSSIYQVKDLFNQKDYCSSLWLITTKFDNFYEVKRKKKKKKNTNKQFLKLEVCGVARELGWQAL